jgi:hypothetical protein
MSERLQSSIRRALTALIFLALPGLLAAQTGGPRPDVSRGGPPNSTLPAAAETDPDVALARKAALEWLALVDAFKFDATWEEAALVFQKGQKKEAWVKGLGDARPTRGKLLSRTFLNFQIRTNLSNFPKGKYVTIRFNSSFEKHPKGSESVTLVRDGARGFRMMSYFLD